MKKIVLSALLGLGTVLSVFYVAFSYIFTDESILYMLGQTKPEIPSLVISLQNSVSRVLTNQIGLLLLAVLAVVAIILTISKKSLGWKGLILAALIPSVLVFSYPVVSRDIFSYLFYAKTVLVYHLNPYLVAPERFWGVDMWIGFIHNTERVYAYGPIALAINLIPMALVGAERFLLNVYVYKVICLVFFLFGAWLFYKISKKRNYVIALWLLNPFVINELLINGHNDLMMVVFFWLAIYLKQRSKTVLSVLAYLLSAGTKYVTVILLPILFMPKKIQELLAVSSIVVIGSYLIYNGNLLWYFSWMFFCLPYIKLNKAQVLLLLLLHISLTLNYSGFLEYGLWGTYPNVHLLYYLIKAKALFIPLFVASTVYPYFLDRFNSRRFF